ncbi:hypothetical protein [Streptomyces sp. NPDC001250]
MKRYTSTGFAHAHWDFGSAWRSAVDLRLTVPQSVLARLAAGNR